MGIGRQFAVQLVKRGYRVIAVARSEEKLLALQAELGADRLKPFVCDLENASEVERLVANFRDAAEPVELLVNNAGFGSLGGFATRPEFESSKMVRLNVEALTRLTEAFLPEMLRRRRGGMIQVASVVAYQPMPYMATYGATKAYVRSFVRALQSELKGSGVRMTVVCPGPVPSGFQERAGFSISQSEGLIALSAEKTAEEALNAYFSGKEEIITGFMNRLVAKIWQRMPLGFARRLVVSQRGPGTKP